MTFEPLVRFQKSWAFWKALEMGYVIVLKRKKNEKKCLPPPPSALRAFFAILGQFLYLLTPQLWPISPIILY